MRIEPGSKLVMIGDSITDCDREFPVGEAIKNGLGNGYVNLVNALLTATYPDHRIRIVNMGTGGNTVLDLAERWNSDVIAQKPDWLSVMIGINDVWRQFDSPLHPEWHVPLETYKNTLNDLLSKTRPQLKGLILISPYLIEPNHSEPMRAMMDTYGQTVRALAEKFDAIFVDTQAAFDVLMKDLHPMSLAWDRVHPGLAGHTVIARAFLSAIEYKW
ncbi:MAG: SGNH/GDSL hydrolase family protein [Anaerolineaceae bacterium]|nr:SGNH/GDSL hydrolase family protein [Anaerolineaceae bacterium]